MDRGSTLPATTDSADDAVVMLGVWRKAGLTVVKCSDCAVVVGWLCGDGVRRGVTSWLCVWIDDTHDLTQKGWITLLLHFCGDPVYGVRPGKLHERIGITSNRVISKTPCSRDNSIKNDVSNYRKKYITLHVHVGVLICHG